MKKNPIWVKLAACTALLGCIVGVAGWLVPTSANFPGALVGFIGFVVLVALYAYTKISDAKPRSLCVKLGWLGERGGGSLSSSNSDGAVEVTGGPDRDLFARAVRTGGWQIRVSLCGGEIRVEVLGPGGKGLFVGVSKESVVTNINGAVHRLSRSSQGAAFSFPHGKVRVWDKGNVHVVVREGVKVKVGGGDVSLQARVRGQCRVSLQAGPEGGTLFAESSPPARGLLQAIQGARRGRRNRQQQLEARKRAIEALPVAQQREELELWRSMLVSYLDSAAEARVRREEGDLFHSVKRAGMKGFGIGMIVVCLYVLIATPQLSHPVPGWEWFVRLRGGPLFWVGGATGMLAIVIARGLILRFNPDRRDRAYARLLGNRGRLVFELWLGGMPMASVIGVFVDMALGYVFAQALTSYVYRGESPVVFAALVSVFQMPFGGIFYLIRSAALFGFPSPEERALQWVEAQRKRLDGGQGQPAFIKWMWWVVLGVVPLVYSGSLITLIHWPRLVSAAQAALIGGLTTLSGVAMGLMFALLASLFARMLREGRGAGADPSGRAQDLVTALIGAFGNLSPLVGTLAVLIWGRGYSSHDAALLGAAYQQFFGILISTLSFMYMVWMQARRRQLTQTQPVPATQPQAGYQPASPPSPTQPGDPKAPTLQERVLSSKHSRREKPNKPGGSQASSAEAAPAQTPHRTPAEEPVTKEGKGSSGAPTLPEAAYPPIPQPSPAPQQPTRPAQVAGQKRRRRRRRRGK